MGSERSLLAEVEVTGGKAPDGDDVRLRDAILQRRTNRFAFESRQLSPELLAKLRAAAHAEGAELCYRQGSAEKHRVAELIAEGEHRHLANPAFRNELHDWIRRRMQEGHDRESEAHFRLQLSGDQHRADAQSDISVMRGAEAARAFAGGDQAAAHQRARAEGAPVLALLTSPGDTRRDWLNVGQALQRVLLAAAAEGVSASYLNPPIEIGALRSRVAEVFKTQAKPQVLLRLGYASPAPPTPRRSADQVLLEER